MVGHGAVSGVAFTQHFGMTTLGLGPRVVERLDYRLMHPAVARDDIGGRDIQARSIHIADVSAGLLNHQRAGRNIPLLEPEFPKSVGAPAGNIREVERGRTGAAHALSAHHESLPEGQIITPA